MSDDMFEEKIVKEEVVAPLKESKTPTSSMLGFRCSLDIIDDIDKLARAAGTTRSDIVEEAVYSWLGKVNEMKVLEDLESLMQMRDHLANIYARLDTQDAKLNQILQRLS